MQEGPTVKSARTEEEIRRVADFLETVLGHGRDYVLAHPDLQFAGSRRYVEHRGAVVSALVLERMKLSFGNDCAAAARIECVATAREFRRQGLCRLLINDALGFLKTNGTELVVIFGEPLFRKFGFEYCIPTYAQSMPVFSPPGSNIIPTDGLGRFRASLRVDVMQPDDLPQIAVLHEEDNPPGNLSRRRPMYYWEHLVSHHGIEGYRVVRSQGGVEGYFRAESSQELPQVKEVVAVTKEACSSILHGVYETARRSNVPVIVFSCPHGGTFGAYLRAHGAAEYSPYAERETTLQLRVLNLAGCVRKLSGSFSARILRSEFARSAGRYRILTEDESVVLDVCDGKVDVLEEAPDANDVPVAAGTMAQLLSGFRMPDDPGEGKEIPGEQRLMEVLFPPTEPFWYVDDV